VETEVITVIVGHLEQSRIVYKILVKLAFVLLYFIVIDRSAEAHVQCKTVLFP